MPEVSQQNRESLRRNWKAQQLVLAVSLVSVSLPQLGRGQQDSGQLAPTEAYKAALAPFAETRSQADDLTDADKYALGIGIASASRDCLTLSSNKSAFANVAVEVFALGQLCVFGQQFEPARAALVDYLALPQPAEREQALLLLVRAFLGMKDPGSAEPQLQSLLRDYPYDAAIHGSIDQVIDAAEGTNRNDLALALCQTQNAITLPLLSSGKSLEEKAGGTSAAKLFLDAMRCTAIAHSSKNPDHLDELVAIARQPRWSGTADLAPMQSALERQQMVGRIAPLRFLRGYALGAKGLVPKAVGLKRGTILLVAFTLWSPSTPGIVRNLVRLTPQQTIYAITSWRANTGREDVPSKEVMDGLRSWQGELPRRASILLVPDSVLNDFHSDVFPGGVLIRDGEVLSNLVLSGEGAQRNLINAAADDSGKKR